MPFLFISTADQTIVTIGRANEVVMIDTQSNTVAARIPAGALPWGVALADVK
jgi:YVTN family beta-propeller protein